MPDGSADLVLTDAGVSWRLARNLALNGYEVLPSVHVNGELTLGENIADLGGITLAYEALQRSLAGQERKLIDGLTPEQRFFISWAQVWRTNMRENALRQLVATDPHAPGQIRAFGPLVSFQPFYDAFSIKEGDPMWLPPEKRTKPRRGTIAATHRGARPCFLRTDGPSSARSSTNCWR